MTEIQRFKHQTQVRSSAAWARGLFTAILLLIGTSRVDAAVALTFYSHELGTDFPHAFILLAGTDDRSGEKIDANYGFTATHISPGILFGPVKGEVFSRDSEKDARYLASSDKHFTIQLTDEQYVAVMTTVDKWRNLKQPSYDLNRQNCVHFVADVAATLGMTVATPKGLMKKPRSFIESLTAANRQWLAEHRGLVLREPAAHSSEDGARDRD